MRSQMPPLWASIWLYQHAVWLNSIAKPGLAGLAIISSGTAVIGFASQFDPPDLGIYRIKRGRAMRIALSTEKERS